MNEVQNVRGIESIKDTPEYSCIKRIATVPLDDGRNLKEIFNYKNIVSLWWIAENSIFSSLNKKQESKYKRTLRHICEHPFLIYFVLISEIILRSIIGKIIDLLYCRYKKHRDAPRVLFVCYFINWRKNSNPKIKMPKKDIQLGDIIEKVKEHKVSVNILNYYDSKVINIPVLFEKMKYQKESSEIMEKYISLKTIINSFYAVKNFYIKWKKLQTDRKFGDLLQELEKLTNMSKNSLVDELKLGVCYYMPKTLLYIEIMKEAIKINKAKVIVISYEEGPVGMAALISGKSMKVPIIAIQHGIIGKFYPWYIREKGEISTDIDDINKLPIPDKTLVFGPYDKKVLTEISSYPNDSVVVVGRSSYDILAKADEIFNREKTFEKLNLDRKKKLIVWTTNSHAYRKEANEKLFQTVCETFKELSKDFELVIKLHPNEFDTTIHKEIAKKVGVVPVIIKDIDVYEILYACDLMLTEFSTTGIEAAILNKPIITLHFAGHPDLGEYVKKGVALGCYKEEDLIINIKKALYDKETQEKLKKAREKFIYEHAYLQDGKATERICNLIEEMINKK